VKNQVKIRNVLKNAVLPVVVAAVRKNLAHLHHHHPLHQVVKVDAEHSQRYVRKHVGEEDIMDAEEE